MKGKRTKECRIFFFFFLNSYYIRQRLLEIVVFNFGILYIHSFIVHLLIMNNNIIICNHHDMVSMMWSFWTLTFRVFIFLFFLRESFNLWRLFLMIVFIIRPKHQSVFDVGEDWTPDLLFNHQRLYQLS